MRGVHLNAIAYREGDFWIIQGIEFDIVAKASDPAELPEAFEKAVVHNLCVSKELFGDSFAGIKPAPPRFKELFEKATTTVGTRSPSLLGKLPGAGMDIRLIGEAA